MKKRYMLLFALPIFLLFPMISSAATYSMGDYVCWSMWWDDIVFAWDAQQQTWSNGSVVGQDTGVVLITHIVSSDGAIGRPVYVEVTFDYNIEWVFPYGNESRWAVLNADNYAGADSIDIWADFGGALSHVTSSGSAKAGFVAETGSDINYSPAWAGPVHVDLSGIHLYDNNLDTAVVWGVTSWHTTTGYTITPISEPATIFLLGLGLMGVVGIRRKVPGINRSMQT